MGGESSTTSTSQVPQVYSRFIVQSGFLCYGDLHNLWHGATGSIQSFPPPAAESFGTIKVHKLEPCVSALCGTWVTYQLVDINTQVVHAWFVCHSSVNCEEEITKILRVSGSPYESYSGYPFNNVKTAAEGVLVINRYDWGLYDKRGMTELGINETDPVYPPFSAGLVDRDTAKDQVMQWKVETGDDRTSGESGVWLHLPEAEYLFSRFGFDDGHTAARSFLFFSGSTNFMRTGFRGLSRSVRKEETDEQLFLRALDEGEQFEGLGRWTDYGIHQVPSVLECLVPFDPTEHLLEPSDWDVLREYAENHRQNPSVRPFAEPLKENILALLDDLSLTCLMRFVEPLAFATSTQEFAALLLGQPIQLSDGNLDSHCYSYLTGRNTKTIPRFDSAGFEGRLRNFLIQRCGEHTLLNNSDFMAGVRQYMVFVLIELLELAVVAAIDNYHVNVVPGDIRSALINDDHLLSLFRLCKTFWHGRR